MKVLMINGSPNEHGNTFQAFSEAANTLNAEGIETEIVSIGKQAEEGMQTMWTLGRNMAWMIKELNATEDGHPQQEQSVWTNFIK